MDMETLERILELRQKLASLSEVRELAEDVRNRSKKFMEAVENDDFETMGNEISNLHNLQQDFDDINEMIEEYNKYAREYNQLIEESGAHE